MGYYLAKISISLTCQSDAQAIKDIENILTKIREHKNINPYIDSFKKAIVSVDGKSRNFDSIDNTIIKNLNNKK